MTRHALIIRNLVISNGARRLVDGVDLSLEQGQTLGLIGESGSGKSLTALSAIGLLPDGLTRNRDSSIRVDGSELPQHDAKAMRALRGRKVGMVFQDPMASLNPFMRTGDQIDEMLLGRGLSRTERRARIDNLLDEVELPAAFARRYPHELSGGQQQRIMLAMGLAGEPRLLIADEPTSALDATVRAGIVSLLRDVQRRHGMSLLIITHDLEVAGALADHIVVMRQGRIEESRPTRALMASSNNAYTAQLLGARELYANRRGLSPADRPPVVEANNVAVDYPSRSLFGRPFRAVEGVSFRLAGGRTLGLIGESGSGKSTLASAIAGLLPLAHGEARVLGHALKPRGAPLPRSLRRRCQMVLQNPYGALNSRLSIAQALAEPLTLTAVPAHAHGERIAKALIEVGMDPSTAERYPHQLSGGQRQRVCIARALLCEPDVLVCDEVVSALDATVQTQLLQLVCKLQEVRGFSMLFIGHDIDMVRWLSDEVLILHKGRVVDQCSSSELDRTEDRDPYTRQLLASRLMPIAA